MLYYGDVITCHIILHHTMTYHATAHRAISFMMILVLILITRLMLANASANVNPNHVHHGNSVAANACIHITTNTHY